MIIYGMCVQSWKVPHGHFDRMLSLSMGGSTCSMGGSICFYSIQMHAVAIHMASTSDNRVYLIMLIISCAKLNMCPELVVLAVRPVTHSGVRSVLSVASMVAMASLVRLVLLMSGTEGACWYWYSRFRCFC